MSQIINFVTHFIISFIDKSGYLGIFTLMAAESALIPIPSEVTMTFAGYLVTLGKFNLYWVIIVGAFANLFGSLLAFYLGYYGGETVVRNLIKKYGKFVLIDVRELDRSEKWFRKYGEKIVFFSRILPIVRTFISLPAGIAKMNIWKFSIFTLVGSLIWSGILAYIGVVLGANWKLLEVYYRKFELVIVAAGIVIVAYYIWHKLRKFRKKIPA
jgi:membrane protein DedA with SNARE-associated domain